MCLIVTMQKGFALPVVLIVTLVLVLPVVFWIANNDVNLASSTDVKGTSTIKDPYAKPGFSVSIMSKNSPWELVEYLCEEKEICTKSLTSGKRWGSVSGDKSDLHQILVETSPTWNGYKYMKFYVKTPLSNNHLAVLDLGSFPESEVYTLAEGSYSAEAVIVPIEKVASSFYKSATFSNSN